MDELVVALHADRDSPGKRDASGAFRPEARALGALWKGRGYGTLVVGVDNGGTPLAIRRTVTTTIAGAARRAVLVAVLCHGWRSGLQLGWTIANVRYLAEALAIGLADGGAVALYACDAARDADRERDDDLDAGPGGEGGFADVLRDELRVLRPDWTGWVDAHTTAAHTTKNPDVRRFEADGRSEYLVARKSARWRFWRMALQSTDLRFRFPRMTRAEIEAELGG